jgi:hypothetical protein
MNPQDFYDFGQVNLFDRDSIDQCFDTAAEDVRLTLDIFRDGTIFETKKPQTLRRVIEHYDHFQEKLDEFAERYDELGGHRVANNNSSYLNAISDSTKIKEIARKYIAKGKANV